MSRRDVQLILWAIPLIGVIASALFADIIIRYNLPFVALAPTLLVGPKITFLSVLLALGMFQYRYFYDEMLDITKKVTSNDFGPGWADFIRELKHTSIALGDHQKRLAETETMLKDLRQAATTGAASADAIKRCEETMLALSTDGANLKNKHEEMSAVLQKVNNKISASMNDSLIQFGIRLALIFMVGFLILTSVLLDLMGLWHPKLLNAFTTTWAQSSLIGGVVGFAILMLFFLHITRSHISVFGAAADNLQPKQ